MRRLQICLSLLLVAACFGQSGNVNLGPLPGMQFVNRTHRLGRGLIAYWPMNERSGVTVFDLSGNGNTGTFGFGTASPIWVSGKWGSALSFDGDNDYNDFGTSIGNFGLSSFTYLFDVLVESGSGTDAIFVKGNPIEGNGYGTYLLDTDEFRFFIRDADSNRIYADRGSFNDNEWNRVACVVDRKSDEMIVYINGIATSPIDISAVTGTLGSVADRLSIGEAVDGDVARFANVRIDIPMIYNRALSASEIALLYWEPFCMFKHGNIELMAKVAEAPPSVVPTLYYYSFVPIPLVIIGYCFMIGRKNE